MDRDRNSNGFHAFKLYTFILFTAVTSGLLCSCASSERMMRLSPFRHQQQPLKTGPVSSKSQATVERHSGAEDFDARFKNHVNLWPLLYSEGDFTSILWPMIDFDPQGMAVRPFYNHEKNEYSILFPLSAWNPRKNKSWVLSGYWKRSRSGIFPFYHIRTGNKELRDLYLLCGLLGHYSYESADDYHFSVLNYLQSNGRNSFYNSVLPIYFYANDNKSTFFWLFNTIYANCKKQNETNLTVLPLSYYHSSPSRSKFWLLNYYYSGGEKRKTTCTFFPFYWYRKKRSGYPRTHLIMGGLLGHYRQTAEDKSTMSILNFVKTPDSHAFIPLYWYTGKGSEHWLNILGLSGFKYNNELKKAWILPLMYYNSDHTLWLFPYYKINRNSGIFPLYNYKSNGYLKELIIPPLFSGFSSSPGEKNGLLMAFLFYYDLYKNRDAGSVWSWPLFYSSWNDQRDCGTIIPFLFEKSAANYYDHDILFSKDDLKQAALPKNETSSIGALFCSYREEHHHKLLLPGDKYGFSRKYQEKYYRKKCTTDIYKFSIFPFFKKYEVLRPWDTTKLNDELNSLAKRIKLIFHNQCYLKDYDKYMKSAKSGHNIYFYHPEFKLKYPQRPSNNRNPKSPQGPPKTVPPITEQLESFKKLAKTGIIDEQNAIKIILKKYGCGDVDVTDKSKLAKALYDLQQRYTTEQMDSSTSFFPFFYYSKTNYPSILKKNFWLMPFYSFDDSTREKTANGFIPLYTYSRNPDKSQLIIWPLLSGSYSKRIKPDWGFPTQNVENAMNKAGLKDGKETSTLSLLLFPTESRHNSVILPNPQKNEKEISSSRQIFWLFNHWTKEFKSWNYTKVEEADINRLYSDIRSLAYINFWKPLKNMKSKALPWVAKEENSLRQVLVRLGYDKVDIKSPDALMKVLVEIDKKYTVTESSSGILIPPLFYRSTKGNDEYWNILLLLSDYEKKGSYSKFSILKYLLRVEEKNDKFSCDVFPFINYSSENTKSSFSFMWRLFRMEKSRKNEKNNHKLYLFFIPFEW